jgi:inward rectifier potassium channel
MTVQRETVGPTLVEVVGVRRRLFGDAYHDLLQAPWWITVLFMIGAFLVVNVLFGIAYEAVGGVDGARPDSLADYFFFSVQTMGTIGYGVMHPVTLAAEALVTLEVLVGLSILAITTGLLFAKFSVPRALMQFAGSAVIAPFDGVPTLMFRLGNQRASQIIEATVRVVLVRTERTKEGVLFYRMRDVPLERDRSPNIARSWTVMHRIDAASPLYGATPESLARDEVEFTLTVVGVDEASAQNVHARQVYDHTEVRWGARHADMLSEQPDGTLRVDVTQFHELTPTAPIPGFAYPR